MKEKRARARAAARGRVAEGVPATKVNPAVEGVLPWRRQLGWRAAESRIAAAACEAIPGAPLEERVRVALACAGRNRFPRAFSGPGQRGVPGADVSAGPARGREYEHDART